MALVVVASMPAALVVTFLAMPLWIGVESRLGIEAVGHSGPATWCFLVVYALFLVGGGTLLRKLLRSRRRTSGAARLPLGDGEERAEEGEER